MESRVREAYARPPCGEPLSIRQRSQRQAALAHLRQSSQRGDEPGAVVGADRGDVELFRRAPASRPSPPRASRPLPRRSGARRSAMPRRCGSPRSRRPAPRGRRTSPPSADRRRGPRTVPPSSANRSRRTRVVAASPIGPIEPAISTSRPVIARASRASFTAVELIDSNSSSRNRCTSLRLLAPNVLVWISSAPALMKPTWSETTASGARRHASSGQRRRGTAADSSAPIPPSATIGRPDPSRSRNPCTSVLTLVVASSRLAQGSASYPQWTPGQPVDG